MGGNAGDTLQHLAGYGVGALSALTSIKGGGLQNFFLNRQRAIEDPAFRASLVGSPFTAGEFFQSGADAAAPGAMPAAGASAQPGETPAAATVAGPSDVAWLQQQTPARRFVPNLPPLPAETQVQVQAAQGIVSGLQSADPVVRAQAKLVGKIPLTSQEQDAVVGRGKTIQGGLGPGGTVGVEAPGMPITIGSPYSVEPGKGLDEFPTYGEALAAARLRGSDWTVEQTQRGTFRPVQATPPMAPPRPGAISPAGAPPQPTATAPRTPAPTVPPPGRGAINTPPPPTPAPPRAPAPSARTGTPGLGAGFVALPEPPKPPPAYAGGPYDPNAIASTPAAPPPRVGFPSPAFDEGAAPDAGAPAATAPPPQSDLYVYPAQGVVFHHSGGSTLDGLRATLKDRGLGSEYVMDRDGTIYNYAGAGSPHMQPNDRWGGIAPGLTNKNAVGMEVVAKNDRDVTPAQVAAAQRFVATNYPTTPVYGHGEVNPGHKEASEGMTVVNAIRTARAAPAGAAAPGFLGRAVAFLGPSSAEAAEVPGWGPPPTTTAQPATAPPDTSTPQFVPPPSPTLPAAPPPPRSVTRPGAAVAPEVPAGTAPLPLTRRSYTSASGQQDVYELGPPSEMAADAAHAGITDFRYASPEQLAYFDQLRDARMQRAQKGEEDIRRVARPLTESEAKATDYLYTQRDKLNQFYKDFDTPEKRDQFVGWPHRNVLDYLKYLHANPEFQRFVDDLSPFQEMDKHSNMLQDGGVNLSPGKIPTGYEPDPQSFENRLEDFNFDLNKQIYRQIALRQMSVGDLSAGAMNVVQSYFDRLYDERVAARNAATAPPTDTGATITVAPPTTTTTQPPARGPGGFVVLGDHPMP